MTSGGYSWRATTAEALTMSAAPHLTSSRPDGTEAVGSLQTLARDTANSAGQTVSHDAYFSLSGLTYSTSATLGTENTNYYRTRLGYDSRGRLSRTQSPTRPRRRPTPSTPWASA